MEQQKILDITAYRLEEYKALKTELGRRQVGRLTVLAFVIAAFGAILNFAFEKLTVYGTGDFICLLILQIEYFVLAIGAKLNNNQTRHINFIAAFIRRIEKTVGFIGWEHLWTAARDLKKINSNEANLPLGTGNILASIYTILIMAVIVISIFLWYYQNLNYLWLLSITLSTIPYYFSNKIRKGLDWNINDTINRARDIFIESKDYPSPSNNFKNEHKSD